RRAFLLAPRTGLLARGPAESFGGRVWGWPLVRRSAGCRWSRRGGGRRERRRPERWSRELDGERRHAGAAGKRRDAGGGVRRTARGGGHGDGGTGRWPGSRGDDDLMGHGPAAARSRRERPHVGRLHREPWRRQLPRQGRPT